MKAVRNHFSVTHNRRDIGVVLGGGWGVQTRSPEQPPQPCGYRHTRSPRDENGQIHLQLKPSVSTREGRRRGAASLGGVSKVNHKTKPQEPMILWLRSCTHTTPEGNPGVIDTPEQPPHQGRRMFTNAQKYLGCSFEWLTGGQHLHCLLRSGWFQATSSAPQVFESI